MDNDIINQAEALKLLKQLTIQDFLNVGLDQVAYIKQIDGDIYSIHAADGSQISVMDFMIRHYPPYELMTYSP